eukprot:1532725-Rhodomonas_salina.1
MGAHVMSPSVQPIIARVQTLCKKSEVIIGQADGDMCTSTSFEHHLVSDPPFKQLKDQQGYRVVQNLLRSGTEFLQSFVTGGVPLGTLVQNLYGCTCHHLFGQYNCMNCPKSKTPPHFQCSTCTHEFFRPQ